METNTYPVTATSTKSELIEPLGCIYIVQGSTGEYSDHIEWFVKAFASEEKAKALVLKASERARALQVEYSDYWDIPCGANEYDPRMQSDYTGTIYNYFQVPFEP